MSTTFHTARVDLWRTGDSPFAINFDEKDGPVNDDPERADVLVITYDGEPPPPLLDAACVENDVLDLIVRTLRGERVAPISAADMYIAVQTIGPARLKLCAELCGLIDDPEKMRACGRDGARFNSADVQNKLDEIRLAKGPA